MSYLDTELRNIINVIEINESEIAVEVSNPIFSVRNSYGVSFQPTVTSYSSYSNENRAVLVFPVIQQYFHNFLEIFPKILNLRNQKNFTVVLVYPGSKNEEGIFNSLIYESPKAEQNASHIKDFLDFVGVEYLCLSPEELINSRFSSVFLYYDDSNYLINDPSYFYNNSSYKISHFLQVPKIHILRKNVNLIRSLFTQGDLISGKKLFVSRKKTVDRPYKYVDEMENLMKDLGYSITYFEDMRWIDQIEAVMSSESLVCQYGSALVNCMLMDKMSSVKAIKYVEGYDVFVYADILNSLGIRYEECFIDSEVAPSIELLGRMV
jgi:hypothetical protein